MILDGLPHGYCIPIVIGDGPSLSGPRLGGAPPDGVFPVHSAEAHYLLTFALEQDGTTELSIFLHPDWWDILFDYSGTLHRQEETWVEVIVHGRSVRDPQNTGNFLLPPCPFLIDLPELDYQGQNAGAEAFEPLWQHKHGGRPYFVRYDPVLIEAIQNVEQSGYRLLFQLAFPGPKDFTVAGNWPFLGGLLYLFFKHDKGQYHWYYGWLY